MFCFLLFYVKYRQIILKIKHYVQILMINQIKLNVHLYLKLLYIGIIVEYWLIFDKSFFEVIHNITLYDNIMYLYFHIFYSFIKR